MPARRRLYAASAGICLFWQLSRRAVTAADIRAQESVFCRAPCNLLRQKGKNYMNQTLSLTKLFSELCDEGKFQKITR